MARGLLLLTLAALLVVGLVVGWTRPGLLPAELRPEGLRFERVYADWEQALKARRHDDALAIVDEYLLFGADLATYEQDARGMRLLAVRRGASGPETADGRDLRWRAERFAARRSAREWAAAAAACALAVWGVVAILRRPRPRAPVEVIGPRPPLA